MSDEAAEEAPEHLIVGQVVAPFGVQGALKVDVLTEFPDRFRKSEQVVLAPFSHIEPQLAPVGALDPATVRRPAPGQPERKLNGPGEPTPYTIESSNIYKGQLRLKLEEVNSADEAESLRGYWVLVPLNQTRQLPHGSYYLYQIVGLDVYTTGGELVGKVQDVIITSANDVYVVRGPGVQDPSGELLVPAIKTVVKSIEPDTGRIVIAPLEEWT